MKNVHLSDLVSLRDMYVSPAACMRTHTSICVEMTLCTQSGM